METVEKKMDTTLNQNGIQISAEPQIAAISARFSGRGLAKTIIAETEAQIEREKKTQAEEPEAYRLSTFSDGYVGARYRHGKDYMSGNDLLEYFHETRDRRTQNADFCESAPADDEICRGEAEKECLPAVRHERAPGIRERAQALPKKMKALPRETVERVKLSYPTWFDASRANTKGETKRFPLSAFAAVLTVAVSLMLVVASSVIVNHAEGNFNTLKREVSQVAGEVADLEADLSVRHDLLVVRDVAVNEYGMVSEDFLSMEYVSGGEGDSVVVYEQEKEEGIGLGALLSALGIR